MFWVVFVLKGHPNLLFKSKTTTSSSSPKSAGYYFSEGSSISRKKITMGTSETLSYRVLQSHD